MDVRQMRQVLAIHRHGSFGKAAEALGISQPTLSKSIARLEDELRLKLFDRSGSGAAATAIGTLIVERAERIIGETQRLARDVKLAGAGELGEVRIGIGATFRSTFLADFTEAIARRYPLLRLEVIAGSRELLIRRLREGECDLVIVSDADDLDPRETVKVELIRDTAVAVAAPNHPLATRNRITIDELAGFRCVSAIPDSGVDLPNVLGLAGEAARNATHFVVNDFEPGIRLVTAGLAVALAPQHLVRPEIDAGRLVRLPLDWSREYAFVAAMTPAASHSPVIRQIEQMARVSARALDVSPVKSGNTRAE